MLDRAPQSSTTLVAVDSGATGNQRFGDPRRQEESFREDWRESMKKLIAVAGGRTYTLRLADNTDPDQALDYLTRPKPDRENRPDRAVLDDWLETEEGFRVNSASVEAYIVGVNKDEWAVAGEA
jgi:hypothetical protein